MLDRPQVFPAVVRYFTMIDCIQLGEFDAGMCLVERWFRELNAQQDALGSPVLFFHISHGRLQSGIGNFDAAIRAYELAMDTYREEVHGNFYQNIAWPLGLAYALAGRVRESLEQFDRAAEVMAKLGSKAGREMRLLQSGRALIEAGRNDEAARMAQDALDLACSSGNRPSEAGALGLLGEVARQRDPVPQEEMESVLLKALALAEMMEMRPLAARCHLRLAWLYSRTGRQDSLPHQEAAETLLNQMNRPLSLEAAGVLY